MTGTAWYATGTVAIANGAATVTGTGTAFLANVNYHDGWVGPDGNTYDIQSVDSDLQLTLARNYIGTTVASGGLYSIIPAQGYVRSLALQAATLINSVGALVALTPGDKDIIQYRTSAYATRTPLQYLIDQTSLLTEVNVASAGTADIGPLTSPKVQITGTSTITSLGTTVTCLRYVRFGGALTLTNNATSLILPGNFSITTAAGDTGIFLSDGSGNYRCYSYKSFNDGSRWANSGTSALNWMGINKVPGTVLDIDDSRNAAAAISLNNSNTGTSVQNNISMVNSACQAVFVLYGHNFGSAAGVIVQDGLLVTNTGAGGVTINTGNASGQIQFGINNAVVGAIDLFGNFVIGATAGLAAVRFYSIANSGGSKTAARFDTAASTDTNLSVRTTLTSGDNTWVNFYTDTSTVRGSISFTRAGPTTNYNATSDERLKTNFVPAGDAGAIIDRIPVYSFDWKESGTHVDFGFVAQRTAAALEGFSVPGVVTPANDHTDTWFMDQAKMMPLAIREIQSLRARVAELEGEVA